MFYVFRTVEPNLNKTYTSDSGNAHQNTKKSDFFLRQLSWNRQINEKNIKAFRLSIKSLNSHIGYGKKKSMNELVEFPQVAINCLKRVCIKVIQTILKSNKNIFNLHKAVTSGSGGGGGGTKIILSKGLVLNSA